MTRAITPLWRVCGLRPCRAFSPSRGRDLFLLVPMLLRGNRNGQRNVCIPTQERGNEKLPPLALLRAAPLPRLLPLKGGGICFSLFPCSRVGTGTVSVMYAFPRRSVGTRNYPPLALLRAAPLPRLLPLKGGGICFSLFPCARVGTRNGQRNVCIPTQERGNEKRACQTPATSIPLALLIPPLALLRAAPLPRLLPLKGGGICFSLFPCSRVGTRTVSVMYAFPRRSVGMRNYPLWRCCGLRPCRAFSPSRGRDLFLLVPMRPRGNKKRSA